MRVAVLLPGATSYSLAAHAPQKHGLKERSGASSNIFANDKKKRASGGMELKKNPNAKRQFFPLRCVMHSLCRSLKCCAFLQTITPPALLHLFSQQTACGNRFFAIQRRPSLKAQGAAKKGCGKALQSSFFPGSFLCRNPLPAAKKVRAIEIAIAILLHKMCSSHSCFVCLYRARRSA
jgi:hypothetical protein